MRTFLGLIALSVLCIGIQFKVTWTEPTTNADGTALTDLSRMTLYYQVNSNIVKTKIYAAKSVTGGTARSATLTVPLTCGKAGGNTVSFWLTATDITGNESESTGVMVKQIPQML